MNSIRGGKQLKSVDPNTTIKQSGRSPASITAALHSKLESFQIASPYSSSESESEDEWSD